MQAQNKENAILTGSIPSQLLLFFLPICLGSFFQMMYNTADTLIVGQFVGTQALAAVGATNSFVSLLVGFFNGFCSGASIIISQSYGANDRDGIDRQVHVALALAILSGLILTVLGMAVSQPVLTLMGTPADIIDMSVMYLRVYFAGTVPQMIYNIGTGILRAVGDSRRPLYFLIVASFVNIALDLLFVAVFDWGVAGAALATILSQAVSAVLTLRCIKRYKDMPWDLQLRKIRPEMGVTRDIARIGLPGAFQGTLYSISNIFIQSSINGFGTTVVAAWSVYSKIDALFWLIVSAMGASMTTFAGQNFGAALYGRVKKGNWVGLGITAALSLAVTGVIYPSARFLFSLFSDDAGVIAQGVEIIHFLAPCYFMYVCIEVFSGTLRGCGDVKAPTLITVFAICIVRVVWLLCVVPHFHSVTMVEASYPITWVLASVMFILYYFRTDWLGRRILARGGSAASTSASRAK